MASLLEMSDFGGTDAESLLKGINSIFSDGEIPLKDYHTKVVGCTPCTPSHVSTTIIALSLKSIVPQGRTTF